MTFTLEREMTPIVTAWLREQGLLVKHEVCTGYGACDLVGCALNPEAVQRRLQRRKDWKPLHSRLVAVELKMTRIVEGLHQAYSNLSDFGESYAAFPKARAERILARRERWDKYWKNGVGLIAVDSGCAVLIEAVPSTELIDWRVERHVEKFWRERKRLEAALTGGKQ